MRIRDIRIPCYQLLIVPALVWLLGYGCNALVIGRNHGYMPVQGYTECVGHAAQDRGDWMHVCMDKDTRLKFLADWIYTAEGTASPGDALETAGEYSMLPCLFMWFGFVVRDYSEDSGWD